MSLRTLASISFAGAASILGISSLWRIKQSNIIQESNYFKEAVKLMQENRDVKDLIGEDIKVGNVNFNDKNLNGAEETMAWFTVPVGGNLGTGNLYFVITREEADNKCPPVVSKVAFMPDKNPNSVTIIKDDMLPSP